MADVVSAAAEGAQLRQASHGCGCTRGSVAWGHQLQQSWQLHVPATTMLQHLQQGLHWGIGDGAGKLAKGDSPWSRLTLLPLKQL
ncbi:hypothetical protein HaLaN_22493 [Haematococcus lacustris]|uniref:Uncharacterized protein n=1 Tax=Haematococcus lacustris TaxID=44745 RepID=A0A6A0A111_HAELA|nr:hypothetical protein HaLaN_22493 [Haematococcus lacustris]